MTITVHVTIKDGENVLGSKTFHPNFAAKGGPAAWILNALKWVEGILAPVSDMKELEAQEEALAAKRKRLELKATGLTDNESE